ncbi:hypothetical protein Aduo_000392 [Ancylostoma duodenale]
MPFNSAISVAGKAAQIVADPSEPVPAGQNCSLEKKSCNKWLKKKQTESEYWEKKYDSSISYMSNPTPSAPTSLQKPRTIELCRYKWVQPKDQKFYSLTRRRVPATAHTGVVRPTMLLYSAISVVVKAAQIVADPFESFPAGLYCSLGKVCPKCLKIVETLLIIAHLCQFNLSRAALKKLRHC